MADEDYIDDDRDVLPAKRVDLKAAVEAAANQPMPSEQGGTATINQAGVEVAGAVHVGRRTTVAGYFRRAWDGAKSWGAGIKIGGKRD